MRKHKRNKILLICFILIAYVIIKIYVLKTPNPNDDSIPDVILNFLPKD